MVDREKLRREMELNREEIRQRQIALDTNHEAIMASSREVLKRAEEAEQVIYSPPVVTPVAAKAAELTAADIPDAWINTVSTAMAMLRDGLCDEFNAKIGPLLALPERVARIEGQIAALTSMPKKKKS